MTATNNSDLRARTRWLALIYTVLAVASAVTAFARDDILIGCIQAAFTLLVVGIVALLSKHPVPGDRFDGPDGRRTLRVWSVFLSLVIAIGFVRLAVRLLGPLGAG